MRLLKSSVNGDELARIIIEVLHRKINIQENSLLATMRDRASVNTKALQTVSVLYPDMIDSGALAREARSGAPRIRKCGKLPIRENLVIR